MTIAPPDLTLTRRALLKVSAAAALPLAAPLAALSKNRHAETDPDTVAGRTRIYRKLVYSMDSRVGFWWLTGTRYGLVDSQLIPFWQMNIGNIFRVRDLRDGDYEVTLMSIAMYTDVNTGQFMREFVNPYTRKTLAIPYFPPKAVTEQFHADGDAAPKTDAEGIVHTDGIGPAWIEGDRVWVRGDRLLQRDAAPDKPPVRVNDLCTYFGSWHDVTDPHNTMPAAGLMFTDINAWPGWLDMGNQPGSYYSRAVGQKVHAIERMPALWRRLLADQHPDIAGDPAAALSRHL
jgi:hypothetical protein